MKETPLSMGAEGTLFGLCTEAEITSNFGIIILNAGLLNHVGPYRLHVNLARELAQLGCPTIRLDQSGKGESPKRKGLSYDEALLRDFDDTAEALIRKGATSISLIGLCSGADDALVIAQNRSNVSGLTLLDGYAGRTWRYYYNHYQRRLFKVGPWLRALREIIHKRILRYDTIDAPNSILEIRNWSSEEDMKIRYGKVLESGVRVMAVFTRGVEEYYNYNGQLSDFLELDQCDNGLTEIFYRYADHTFTQVADRTRLIEDLKVWFTGQIRPKTTE